MSDWSLDGLAGPPCVWRRSTKLGEVFLVVAGVAAVFSWAAKAVIAEAPVGGADVVPPVLDDVLRDFSAGILLFIL